MKPLFIVNVMNPPKTIIESFQLGLIYELAKRIKL